MSRAVFVDLTTGLESLSPEAKPILEAFLQQPADELERLLLVLHHWMEASASKRAIAVKLLNTQLRNTSVAQLCGLSDRQLRRYPDYMTFVQLLSEHGYELPKGRKSASGNLDAWASEE